jgi:hypothetical protein
MSDQIAKNKARLKNTTDTRIVIFLQHRILRIGEFWHRIKLAKSRVESVKLENTEMEVLATSLQKTMFELNMIDNEVPIQEIQLRKEVRAIKKLITYGERWLDAIDNFFDTEEILELQNEELEINIPEAYTLATQLMTEPCETSRESLTKDLEIMGKIMRIYVKALKQLTYGQLPRREKAIAIRTKFRLLEYMERIWKAKKLVEVIEMPLEERNHVWWLIQKMLNQIGWCNPKPYVPLFMVPSYGLMAIQKQLVMEFNFATSNEAYLNAENMGTKNPCK